MGEKSASLDRIHQVAPTKMIYLLDRNHIYISSLLLICSFLLLATDFARSPGPDYGAYSTYAWLINEGYVPYRDFFTIKTPGFFYFLAALQRLSGNGHTTNVMALVVVYWLYAVAFYYLTSAIIEKRRTRILLTVVLLFLVLSVGFDHKRSGSIIVFAGVFETLAFGFLLRQQKETGLKPAIVGLVVGGLSFLGFLARQTAFSPLVFLLILVFVSPSTSRHRVRAISSYSIAVFCFLLVCLFAILHLLGIFQDFWEDAVEYNRLVSAFFLAQPTWFYHKVASLVGSYGLLWVLSFNFLLRVESRRQGFSGRSYSSWDIRIVKTPLTLLFVLVLYQFLVNVAPDLYRSYPFLFSRYWPLKLGFVVISLAALLLLLCLLVSKDLRTRLLNYVLSQFSTVTGANGSEQFLLMFLSQLTPLVILSTRAQPIYIFQCFSGLLLCAWFGFSSLVEQLRSADRRSRVYLSGVWALIFFLVFASDFQISMKPFITKHLRYSEAYAAALGNMIFHGTVPRNVRVGQYIASHTSENDRIYVFGFKMSLYQYSQRKSPSKFFSGHVFRAGYKSEREFESFMNEFLRSPPEYVAVHREHPSADGDPRYERRYVEQFEHFLEQSYRLETEIGGIRLLHRISN